MLQNILMSENCAVVSFRVLKQKNITFNLDQGQKSASWRQIYFFRELAVTTKKRAQKWLSRIKIRLNYIRNLEFDCLKLGVYTHWASLKEVTFGFWFVSAKQEFLSKQKYNFSSLFVILQGMKPLVIRKETFFLTDNRIPTNAIWRGLPYWFTYGWSK